jgi:hypothetical protein
MTKIRAMFCNRSAVKLSEYENIAKMLKKKKGMMQGPYSGISKTFGIGFKHTKANAQNLIFYLIKCSLVILYYT